MRAALWLQAPPNRVEVQAPPASSVVPPKSADVVWGIKSAELSQIALGKVVEVVVEIRCADNETDVHNKLADEWTRRSSQFSETAGSAAVIGKSWDGTTWS